LVQFGWGHQPGGDQGDQHGQQVVRFPAGVGQTGPLRFLDGPDLVLISTQPESDPGSSTALAQALIASQQ